MYVLTASLPSQWGTHLVLKIFVFVRKLKYDCNNSQKGTQKRTEKIDYVHILSALCLQMFIWKIRALTPQIKII